MQLPSTLCPEEWQIQKGFSTELKLRQSLEHLDNVFTMKILETQTDRAKVNLFYKGGAYEA
jgi:hypothetical protein